MDEPCPIRKQMRRWEDRGDVRFITFSCYRRLPLLGNARIRSLFARVLGQLRCEIDFELFAWVVMPEHVHMLLRPADSTDWSELASRLKVRVARQVLLKWRKLQAPILAKIEDASGRCRFWQAGGGFDRNVRNLAEFTKAVRYIHHNPVERGLVDRPEKWEWSSIRWWMGEREDEIECDPPPGPELAWERWRGFA